MTVFDLATAQLLFDKQGKLDLIRVQAKEGVTDAELLGRSARFSPRRRR